MRILRGKRINGYKKISQTNSLQASDGSLMVITPVFLLDIFSEADNLSLLLYILVFTISIGLIAIMITVFSGKDDLGPG
jgi:DNA integrity scanning protein DisA with diadenylate cyclase activity